MWVFSVLGLACLVAAAGSSATTETGVGDAATTLESLATSGVQGNLYSYAAGISADGRYVVFNSDATNLVPGDSNERSDVFVRDRVGGETVRISVSSSGAQANAGADPFGGSHAYGIDASGRYVVFVSDASNLVASDTNGVPDVFLHDRVTGATSRVSLSSDEASRRRAVVLPLSAPTAAGWRSHRRRRTSLPETPTADGTSFSTIA